MTYKPRLFTVVIFLYRILRQQFGWKLRLSRLQTQRCVQFIDIHTTAINIASKPYSCDIGQCLINFFIIVTYFVWGQHSVFDIVIVTCECAVSNLQTLWSCVCHRYEYTCLTLFLYYFVFPFALFWTTGRGFKQYRYYCYLFHLGTAKRLWHRHNHVWVICFGTMNIMVSCMSSILIHMSYFYFYIILSFHLRCSGPRVVSRYLQIFNTLCTVSSFIQVKNTTYQKVSAIYLEIIMLLLGFLFWCWTFLT